MIDALSAQKLQPKLLTNDSGDLFIQITIGKDKLVKMLPQMDDPEIARAHINKLVPEMAKELYRKIRNRKKRKK